MFNPCRAHHPTNSPFNGYALNPWGPLGIGLIWRAKATCGMGTGVKVDQRRPLSPTDSETQTIGCRHSHPDICRNHSIPGKCAFVRPDNLCLLPPRSWKRIYGELKQEVPSPTERLSAFKL